MEEGGGGEGGEEEEDEEDSDSEGEDGVNVIIDQKRIEEDKTKTIQSMQVNFRKLFLSSGLSLYEEEIKNTEYYRDRDESLPSISSQIKQSQREGGVNKSKKQGTFAVEVRSITGTAIPDRLSQIRTSTR